MEKFIKVLLFCLLPFALKAQVNGTIQLTTGTSVIRGTFGASGIDTIMRWVGPLPTSNQLARYNSTLKGWEAFTNTATGTVTNVSALTLTTTGTDLTSSVANSTTTPVITLNVPTASASNRGALSAADWTTFNNKGSAYTPSALTKTDDTNVTLTLGGTPATALLQASSLTLGWTGTLAAPRGGTGFGSYTTGDLLYASSSSALSKLAGGTTTQLLHSGTGGAPSWGAVALATDVSGILPPVNGGTGIANGTNTLTYSGNTVIGSSTNTVSFATTGNTSVTLPTSGTLATTVGNVATATALLNSRTIGTVTGDATSAGSSFNGTANNTNALTVTGINGTSLGGLATGILKNTTSTGVPSIAVAGDLPGGPYVPIAGNVTMSGDLNITENTNGNAIPLNLRNSNAGSSAITTYRLGNDASAGASTFAVFGSNHSSFPNWLKITNQFGAPTVIGANGADGITLSSALAVKFNAYGAGVLVSDASGNITSSTTAATSGTYTPTFTNGANVTSVTNTSAHYIRTGSQVFVEVEVTMNTTLGANTSSQFQVSLPIASAFTLTTDAVGYGNCNIGTIIVAPVNLSANPTPDNILVGTFAIGTSNTVSFSFTYTVQ